MDISVSIEQLVKEFAELAHKGQKRKYTNDDYIIHPIEVAEMVKAKGGDISMVYASLLHDVLEDTQVTHEQMRAFLHTHLSMEGAEDVLSLVVELTDVYTKENFPDLNRKGRKTLEAMRLAQVSSRAKRIKIADIEHNSKSIEMYDPKFAEVFLEEKEELLRYMKVGEAENL